MTTFSLLHLSIAPLEQGNLVKENNVVNLPAAIIITERNELPGSYLPCSG